MIYFIKEKFRQFIGVLFVLTMIVSVILGGIIGKQFNNAALFIGGIVGLVVGLIVSIVVFGFMATLIQICDNTEELIEVLEENIEKNKKVESTVKKENDIPIAVHNSFIDNNNMRVCKKCGEKNTETATFCRGCGDSL